MIQGAVRSGASITIIIDAHTYGTFMPRAGPADEVNFGGWDSIVCVYAVQSMEAMRRLAVWIGRPVSETARYATLVANARAAYNERFWDDEKGWFREWVDIDGMPRSTGYLWPACVRACSTPPFGSLGAIPSLPSTAPLVHDPPTGRSSLRCRTLRMSAPRRSGSGRSPRSTRAMHDFGRSSTSRVSSSGARPTTSTR